MVRVLRWIYQDKTVIRDRTQSRQRVGEYNNLQTVRSVYKPFFKVFQTQVETIFVSGKMIYIPRTPL